MMGTYDLYIQHAFWFFFPFMPRAPVWHRTVILIWWYFHASVWSVCGFWLSEERISAGICISLAPLMVICWYYWSQAILLQLPYFYFILNLYKHNYCDCLLSSFKSPVMQICFYMRLLGWHLSQWHWNTLELLVNLTVLILPLAVYSEMQTIADSSRTGNMWLDVKCSWVLLSKADML